MSSRTRIAALALVNWKGVFYERYLLDQHVTALEGANGAGKTTVMIAAYIALLPDLTRLRFTNVGETGASGGDRGIWGRLGEPGRPSYTVLDLRVADGSRYIAAVRLTRASEPTLDVTTMGIEGVPDHVPLSSIFLVRHEDSDVVPDLDEIKHNVKAVGGKVTVFRAVKDYFAELFERGISPLRLMTDDDRSKFNDMLRTSMTGGISRSLTSELRGFVLKEESGMSDTLGRMKANLEACRRTRIEVAETRVLEEELAGIYEAGQAMYLAHASALQVHADTAQRNAQQEAQRRNDLAQHVREVADTQANVTRQTVQLSKAAQAARNDQERILTQWERLKSAAGLRAKLGTLDDELAILEHRAAGARAAHEAAQLERVASRQEREQAQSAYERAALGLAELQRGVDELHLRAAEHRRFHFSWSAAN
nr:chromosome partition protein MukB [Kofleriaceae bacterium]